MNYLGGLTLIKGLQDCIQSITYEHNSSNLIRFSGMPLWNPGKNQLFNYLSMQMHM